MTTVTFFQDADNKITGFEADGHADFRKFGKDIVCSAISVLLTNTVNSIDELLSKEVSFEGDSNKGYMHFVVKDYDDEKVQLLFQSCILGLNGILDSYPKNLKLTNRRYIP